MNKIRLLTILIMILGALLYAMPAEAAPGLPYTVTGTATLDGAPAPAGMTISGWINGYNCGEALTVGTSGAYLLTVHTKDTSTPGDEHCGVDGNTVVFHIGSIVANETGIFESGNDPIDTINLTGYTPPLAFSKTSPSNGTTGQAVSLTLSWGTSSNASSYEYCYATTTGCTGWNTAGTNTSVVISGLLNNQIYYWQVRAKNAGGTTSADTGTYWSFTTAPLPGTFSKTGPTNGATNQAINPTLSWGTSSNTNSYEYCYATITGCTSWISAGTSTSVTLSGLSNSTTYYWQVRALNVGGITVANTGTYWSFTTIVAAPAAFGKTSPTNNATGQALSLTLSWGTSTRATSYEYCYATITGCTSWTSVGTNTSIVISGLSNNTKYYWQIRAVNVGGLTVADTGTYWSFTTAPLPGAFAKTSPTNGATNQGISPTLSWGTSSNAASYEYCYATATGCTSWISAGTNTSITLSALSNSTTYYWQVRAVNPGGSTLANSGTYWSFTTIVAAPASFSKTSPLNGSTMQAISPTLSWGASARATSYEYCYATTTGCTAWISAGTNTSVVLPMLINDQIYYWQVHALNAGGTTTANSGTYWSFRTAPLPGAFGKTSPTNSATFQSVSPILSWGTSSNAVSYEYCYATITGCTNWTSAGANTSVTISGLSNLTTYYWQVRAVNPGGITIANTSTYWSFTTAPLPGAFAKIGPADGATNQAVNLTLSWGASSNATSYEYCTATTASCTSWISAGTNTSVAPSGLSNSTTYYWQVRAVNPGGSTLANTGTLWSFTTIVAAPAAFSKTSPANTDTGESISPTLAWGASSRATSYEFCYATTTGCTTWTSTGTTTSVTLEGLSNNQIYYWQVHAINIGGTTLANAGTYWSFTTAPLPGAFVKTGPANGSTFQSVSPTLSWGTSSNATAYEYCYATTIGCSVFSPVGTSNSVTLSGLLNNQVYYWQVRAVNPGGTAIANSGTYWSFITAPLPGAFTKSSPADDATGQSVSPTLSWGTSSNAVLYEYCFAVTSGCTNWISAGTNTSVTLSGLLNEQVYYWQVRAFNQGGTTLANAGTYWAFTTAARPGNFGKTSPTDEATGIATSPTLSWAPSAGVISYEYCYATATGCTSWIPAGTNTSVVLSGLSHSTTYYWQVRAVNPGGATAADSGLYWSFTTVMAPPVTFSKAGPANGATNQVINPTLSWSTSGGASSYEYCYGTTTGCTNWISVGTDTSVLLSGLLNDQFYYWQVRAINPGGVTSANTSTYWSFSTVVAAPGDFGKTNPENVSSKVATNAKLSWIASPRASSYEYCYATTSGCSGWIPAGANTYAFLSGLINDTTYYWQVRAMNAGGVTSANGGTYWSFTTAEESFYVFLPDVVR